MKRLENHFCYNPLEQGAGDITVKGLAKGIFSKTKEYLIVRIVFDECFLPGAQEAFHLRGMRASSAPVPCQIISLKRASEVQPYIQMQTAKKQ